MTANRKPARKSGFSVSVTHVCGQCGAEFSTFAECEAHVTIHPPADEVERLEARDATASPDYDAWLANLPGMTAQEAEAHERAMGRYDMPWD